jgi:inosine-uridine nucleoside N-ribohydrolase
MKKIPVILDTDIGTDIDDTWALGFALRCPEIELKLVTVATGDTEYRAKIVAKYLQQVGRTDIPIGIGPNHKWKQKPQKKYIKKVDLKDYPGKIYENAAAAIVDFVLSSEESTKIVAIGPLENIANAIALNSNILNKAEFVGMHGSVRIGYNESNKPQAEYNVVKDIPSCKRVFEAEWPKTITPLDTCGNIILLGERYQKINNATNPFATNIIENYKMWAKSPWAKKQLKNGKSSVLFDLVAIYLAFSNELLNMEELKIEVTDKGNTIISEKPKHPMKVATSWKDQESFFDMIVNRLT